MNRFMKSYLCRITLVFAAFLTIDIHLIAALEIGTDTMVMRNCLNESGVFTPEEFDTVVAPLDGGDNTVIMNFIYFQALPKLCANSVNYLTCMTTNIPTTVNEIEKALSNVIDLLNADLATGLAAYCVQLNALSTDDEICIYNGTGSTAMGTCLTTLLNAINGDAAQLAGGAIDAATFLDNICGYGHTFMTCINQAVGGCSATFGTAQSALTSSLLKPCATTTTTTTTEGTTTVSNSTNAESDLAPSTTGSTSVVIIFLSLQFILMCIR